MQLTTFNVRNLSKSNEKMEGLRGREAIDYFYNAEYQ